MRKNILFCFVLFLSLLSLQAQRIIPCGCDNTIVYKGKKEWSDSLFVQRNLRAQQAPPQIPSISQVYGPIPVPVIINENMETFYTGYREDWAAGPFDMYGRGYFASPIKVKFALYMPKPAVEFPDHNKRFYLQGYTECPREEIDYRNFQKVYEIPGIFEATKSSDGDYYDTGEISHNWDGMSSPQFTGGVSKPVYDCISFAAENVETGEILNEGPSILALTHIATTHS
jgi:hypothetical protein